MPTFKISYKKKYQSEITAEEIKENLQGIHVITDVLVEKIPEIKRYKVEYEVTLLETALESYKKALFSGCVNPKITEIEDPE